MDKLETYCQGRTSKTWSCGTERREENGKTGTTITKRRDTSELPKHCDVQADAGQVLNGEVVGWNEPGKSW